MAEIPGRPAAEDTASTDKLRSAADDAATQVGHLYVTFLLFGLYIAVTVGATTHEQLLRSAPVELPLLNVQIPLFGFYWIARFLFVLMHFNLLLQFHLLAQKLWRLDLAIERQIAPESARDAQRRLLHSFAFSHMLIGHHHRPLIRALLYIMIWMTVILLPVALLLAVQIRFLPYHDASTTMWHRGLVALDVLLILVLWLRVVWGRDAKAVQKLRRARGDARAGAGVMLALHRTGRVLRGAVAWSALVVVSATTVVASWLILTFPGDPDPAFGDPAEEALLDPNGWFAALYPTAWRVYERPPAYEPRDSRPIFWPTKQLSERVRVLARNLDVRDKNLVTAWPRKEEIAEFGEATAWQNFGGAPSLGGRDLRYGIFSRSTLAHADLETANLQGAVLEHANLQGAVLFRTNLQGAALASADLQGAVLFRTNLQGAALASADLQGAYLASADLQGATLSQAKLQGAVLVYANLQGARLDHANLQGAGLASADLQGATLSQAKLQGAVLVYANLQGASLEAADFSAADLRRARLWRATVAGEGARWAYADLRGATVDSPSAEEREEWKKAAGQITDEPARRKVEEVLRSFEQNLGQDATPTFPADWATKTDVLFDPGARYAKGWKNPLPAIEAFDQGLAGYLIGLTCAETSPAALAYTIARRVLSEPEKERPYRVQVARRLVDGPCPPARNLGDGWVTALRELIRDAPAEPAPEVEAPVASEPTAPAVGAASEPSAIAPAAGPAKAVGKE